LPRTYTGDTTIGEGRIVYEAPGPVALLTAIALEKR
jgi:hypothetical protein